jgi:glycosyltransferase involved in cell wall biosynthesis
MPDVTLWSLQTHENTDHGWAAILPAGIHYVLFGAGESTTTQGHPRFAWREWKKGGRVIAWLKKQQIDIVFLYGYSDAARLRILRWCKQNHIPCMVGGDSNIRGDKVTGLRRLFKRIVVGWVARSADAILPCGSLGQAFFEKYGALPEKMFFYPYEPDYAEIRGITEDEMASVRRSRDLKPDRRRIVFCARLVPVKSPEYVINAFARIARARPDWDLVILGDGPLREQLQMLVPAELNGRVKWLGFVGDQREVSTIYRLSDVLVLPSAYEPWALVINEAVAADMAVVASDAVGAAIELVQDDVNGAVFPTGDFEAFVDRLTYVTDEKNIDRLKRGSAQKLADWRRRADPLAGLQKAIAYARDRCGHKQRK